MTRRAEIHGAREVCGDGIGARHQGARPTEEERLASAARQGESMLKEEVDEEDIAGVVSRWTHIPVSRLMEGVR